MGNPGLFQQAPGVPALRPEGGRHREQPAAADRTFGGLDAMSDLALNHRMAQGPLGGVVGEFHAGVFQEGPERLLA